MTAVEERPDLYVRDGSRFVLYSPAAQHVPPIPVPRPTELEGPQEDPDQPGRWVLPVSRCPHGSFLRWAERNCCRPPGTPPPKVVRG